MTTLEHSWDRAQRRLYTVAPILVILLLTRASYGQLFVEPAGYGGEPNCAAAVSGNGSSGGEDVGEGVDFGDLDEQFAALGGDTLAFAPPMMGNFFGGGFLQFVESGSGDPVSLPIAGGDRRFKIAENVSPVPQDRVFFNFNHFQNSITDIQGQVRSLDRFTFGAEKTFFCGTSSVEVRVPFSSALNSVQSFASGAELTNTEFGNVSLAFKTILWRNECTMLTGGLTENQPTGDDANVPDIDLRVENDSAHLGPFLGLYHRPSDRLFIQSYVQIDIDPTGNDVVDAFDDSVVGVINDQNLLFLDLSIGYWLHRNECSCLTGVAGLFELHYTTTVNDADEVDFNGDVITNPYNRIDIVDLTAGLLFEFNNRSTLSIGATAPVTSGPDNRNYDAELQVLFNRYF
jgi:hypothetical protein